MAHTAHPHTPPDTPPDRPLGVRSPPATRSHDQSHTRFRRHTRGQTLNDFAIGISLFVLTMVFLAMTLPSLLAPFTTTAPPQTASATRIGHTAVTTTFTPTANATSAPLAAQTVNTTCTTAFFANASHTGCHYQPAPLDTTFSLDTGVQLQLRITPPDTDTALTHNNTTLTRGPSPSTSATTTHITRLIRFPTTETLYRLHVILW